MPYYNRDPKRDHKPDNHTWVVVIGLLSPMFLVVTTAILIMTPLSILQVAVLRNWSKESRGDVRV